MAVECSLMLQKARYQQNILNKYLNRTLITRNLTHIRNEELRRKLWLIVTDLKVFPSDRIIFDSLLSNSYLLIDSQSECETSQDVKNILRFSESYDELLYARNKSRRDMEKVRGYFSRYKKAMKQLASVNGHQDAISMEMETMSVEGLSVNSSELWLSIKPLYDLLHNFAWKRLKAKYKEKDVFLKGFIPDHLLGNFNSAKLIIVINNFSF